MCIDDGRVVSNFVAQVLGFVFFNFFQRDIIEVLMGMIN